MSLEWACFVLQSFSAFVLFDALRKIRIILKNREELMMNETNMALHLISFILYLVT